MTMIEPRHAVTAMALLAQTGPAPVADEAGISSGATLSRDIPVDAYSYLLMDVLLDTSNSWVLVEANGSNAAGSIAHGADAPRVAHLLDTMVARGIEGRTIVIAYQSDTPCRPEIFSRAAQLASLWQGRVHETVGLIAVTGEPSAERSVVIGTTEEVAAALTLGAGGRLLWRGRVVSLLSNGNVLPALVRRGVVQSLDEIDLDVLHEGPIVGPLTFDKGAQQDLAIDTTIRPLGWASADDEPAAIAMIGEIAERQHVIVKINAGSGGTGVFAMPAGADDAAIRASIADALARTQAKYGSTATAFPIRAFEFAQGIPVLHEDGLPHLWDLRLQVLVRPGRIEVTPLSARVCPAPFSGELDAAAVICNLTGTDDGSQRVVPGGEFLARLGCTPAKLDELVDGIAGWVTNALRLPPIGCAGRRTARIHTY